MFFFKDYLMKRTMFFTEEDVQDVMSSFQQRSLNCFLIFLKHYNDGKNNVEEKPAIVTNIGKVTKFEINYQDHSSFYDFHNSESIVDQFLFNVKNKIQRSNVEFLIRSEFSLENIQSTVVDFDEPLKNSRYWTTDPIQTKSFNEYVYFIIRESILKRVINNGLTGSSWHFNRFLYINIKTI